MGIRNILLLFLGTIFTITLHSQSVKKIIVLAGKKSHSPTEHEYIKSARLIKTMLDYAENLPEIDTEIHYNGWPEDPSTLDDADLILTLSDGRDGDLYTPVPFMYPDRMQIMEKQMKRGCGFSLIHFSTFASNEWAPQILEWGGGHFDWQDDNGERNWYSALTILDTIVEIPAPSHPIARGIPETFRLHDEFYYNIRFREDDPRLIPLMNVPALEGEKPKGGLVSWAVEREDGGRGFSTTTGHFYRNWKNEHYRRFMLNGIVWAAGLEVPMGGVESPFYSDSEVTEKLYGKSIKSLILTGNHHPAHKWQETTPAIQTALEMDNRIHVDISTDIEDLQYYDLSDYDFLIMNYCNWEDPNGLSDKGKKRFVDYLKSGGGLMLIHFANGAFHSSLPEAGESDWPEFRKICPRVWDHDQDSGHDKYGIFEVVPTANQHPITMGIKAFETKDELYYNQKGTIPITPLLKALSLDTGNHEPLAWTHTYGEGKIFQTLLGHSAESLSTPEIQTILMRAGLWVSGNL